MGIQQLVIWNSLLAHRSPANFLEPIKTPKGTPCSPLISRFYYFPDTVYPFHPAPTQPPIRLFCTDLQQSPGFLLTTARRFLCRTAAFISSQTQKRPRTGFEPRLSASHKAVRIIHRLPRLANRHTHQTWSQNATAEKQTAGLFLFPCGIHVHVFKQNSRKMVFMLRH